MPQRKGIEYIRPPLVHEIVEPARQLQVGLRAERALEDLAVVADVLDDLIGPVARQPQCLTEIGLQAEEAADARLRRGALRIDVGLA